MAGANNTIILKKPGSQQLMSPGIVSVLDPSGFDTVTARYIEQITANEVTKKYAPASTGTGLACPVAGGTMILMGASDTADLPGGCCEYTITWRGLLTTITGRNTQVTKTRSVRERLFDNITGIPNVTGPVKARLLELQSGMTVRQIVTVEPSPPNTSDQNQTAPVTGVTNPAKGYTVVNTVVTHCYPHGWICYSWQSEQPIPGIWFVTAEYKFEHPTSSG